MGKPKLISIGTRFGRLTVINNEKIEGRWQCLCECECGNKTFFKSTDLRTGRIKSCGCLKKENMIKSNTTHGLRQHRLYSIWYGIKTRCYNEKATHYEYYGQRGIKMDKDWVNDFINFYNWSMNNGYSEELTIDRINPNGDYEPSNCRWVTTKVQSNNKRNNRYVTINGITKTFGEWCEINKINYYTAWDRVRRGWSEIEAVTIPVDKGVM